MNKIFKKIWNQSRGCFVAVSEAMTAANQCSGKAVVIGSLGLLLLTNVQAADEYTMKGTTTREIIVVLITIPTATQKQLT